MRHATKGCFEPRDVIRFERSEWLLRAQIVGCCKQTEWRLWMVIVGDGGLFVRASRLSAARGHAQTGIKVVPFHITTAQMAGTALQIERGPSMQHPAIVEGY